MKINIQKLVRVIAPLLSVLCVIIACIIPVDAAVLDYNDYISNVTVDGDNDLVTVDFPLNNVYFALYDYNTGATHERVSLSASFDLSANHRYNLFFLFYYPSDSLSLADIPSDTVFTVDADITSQHNFFDVSLEAFYNINYFYDSNGNYVGSTSNPVSVTDHYTFTSTLPQLASNFASFNPGLQWANWASNYDDTLSVTVNRLTMKFSISSLLRLQQTSGKTNAILKEVEQQLAEQGQKLDDIINGTSDQQNAADQFKDDVNGSVEDLDLFGDVMNNIPYPTIDTDSLVPEDIFYGSSYLTYISAIQEFWKSNTLSTVISVLGSLLLVSYVLFGEKG